jgi:putative flippase GtrA
VGITTHLSRATPREMLAELLRRKFVRYSIASAVAVVVGQSALWFFRLGLGWHGVPANLASVAIGSIPNYTINRYWTWQQRGNNRLWGEIVPFWVMALLGTILSTLFVAFAEQQWGTPLAVSIAQLAGFGTVWFARFLILDKVIWRVVHDLHPEIDLPQPHVGLTEPAASPSAAARANGFGQQLADTPATSDHPA